MLFALGSNIAFSISTFYFAEYSRRISSQWVNFAKVVVAVVGFTLVCTVFNLWQSVSNHTLFMLILSGTFGLFVGDIFIFRGFAILGSGRVLMIWGFQPLLLGVAAYYLFGQDLVWYKLTAIIFLIACVFTFSLESYKRTGSWQLRGILYTLLGVSLDGTGVLLTREAFESSPEISPFFVNFIRCLTALLIYFGCRAIGLWGMKLIEPWRALDARDKKILFLTCFAGTFISLSFYLYAVKIGHLASVTAMTGAAPLIATLYEVLRGRTRPTKYLLLGTLFFLTGFLLLVIF